MDVADELLHVAVKLPRTLDLVQRVPFAAVEVQYRIAGVEHQFEVRRFDPVKQLQRVFPRHAAIVVAILMQVIDARFFAHLHQEFHLAEYVRLNFGVPCRTVPLRLEAHGADHLAVQPLHPDQRPLELFDRGFEILFLDRVPPPVRHRAAEAVDADAGRFQLSRDRVEFLFRQVVEVDAVHRARFDPLPAQFLRRPDLAGDPGGRFVRKSGVIHLW
ncbi:hypothetical protein SDC9_176465 [bioreactor metagenome]|uniref:Uncharacterized protein n=1 Tax=bioreactor metagenome TaxID=1076179 RepID=A0A645GQ59_9ZZZZ